MQRHQHNRFEMGRRVFVNPVKFFFVVVFYELYGFFFDKIPDINVGRCDAILFAQVEDCRDDGEVAVNGSGFAAFLFFQADETGDVVYGQFRYAQILVKIFVKVFQFVECVIRF